MRNSQFPYHQGSLNLPLSHQPMSLSQQVTPHSSYGQPGMNAQQYPHSSYGQRGMNAQYPHQHYGQGGMNTQQQSYIEQIPYEKTTIDYYPQEKVEYIPQEQKFEDYLEVQHELDYVPVPKLEKYTENIPLEKYDTYYDYMPRQNSFVRSVGSNYIPPNQQYAQGSQYRPQYGSSFGPTGQYPSYQGYQQVPFQRGTPSYQGPAQRPMNYPSMSNYPPMGNYQSMGHYPPMNNYPSMGNYQSRGNYPGVNNFAPGYQSRPLSSNGGPYGSSPYSGFSRYRYS